MLFVDLQAAPGSGVLDAFPACPVIGIGSSAHPLAPDLDAVVGSPQAALPLLKAATAQPRAAAVLTQLLRLLPSLDLRHGLVAESLAYAVLQASEAHRDWIAARPVAPVREPGRVRLDRDAKNVLTVRLDRPWAGNAIDRPMRDALHEAFALANADPTIARVVLEANGKTFSLGAELAEFGTTTDPSEAHRIRGLTLPAGEAWHCADRLEARIDGACVGAGLELAAFAHRVTATRRSWFQLPELAMGVLPGAGGCVSVSRRIGRQRTLLMVLSGRRVSAAQALEWGLVDTLVD